MMEGKYAANQKGIICIRLYPEFGLLPRKNIPLNKLC